MLYCLFQKRVLLELILKLSQQQTNTAVSVLPQWECNKQIFLRILSVISNNSIIYKHPFNWKDTSVCPRKQFLWGLDLISVNLLQACFGRKTLHCPTYMVTWSFAIERSKKCRLAGNPKAYGCLVKLTVFCFYIVKQLHLKNTSLFYWKLTNYLE